LASYKSTGKNSNADEANEDAGLTALLAEAAHCMNNADEVLADAGISVGADLAVA
jgi:hypothetical protein